MIQSTRLLDKRHAGDSDCLTYVGSTTADGSGNWSLTGLSLTTGHYATAVVVP